MELLHHHLLKSRARAGKFLGSAMETYTCCLFPTELWPAKEFEPLGFLRSGPPYHCRFYLLLMLYLKQCIWWKGFRDICDWILALPLMCTVSQSQAVSVLVTLFPLSPILCFSLWPQELNPTDHSTWAPFWLGFGWIQSMVDNGKRWKLGGEVFLIPYLLWCSNGGYICPWLQFLWDIFFFLVIAPTRHFSNNILFLPRLALKPQGWSWLFTVFSTWVHHHSLLVPLSLSLPLQHFFMEKIFFLGIEFWVDSIFHFCFFPFSTSVFQLAWFLIRSLL